MKRRVDNIKACFFGDSFVRLFGLIKHPHLRIEGYKGASARGLSQPKNENRRKIFSMLQRYGGGGGRGGRGGGAGENSLDHIIFCFGNVDVHLSYFYKKYALGETIDLDTIAAEYVAFIANAVSNETISRTTVIIVGVYPSAVKDSFLRASLVSYGSLTKEQTALVSDADASLKMRQNRVLAFNKCLSQHCKVQNISYVDTFEEMTERVDSERGMTHQLMSAYRDISDHNIHVVWETTVLLWIEKWSAWYGTLAPEGLKEKLERSLSEYLQTKPWAQRRGDKLIENVHQEAR